MPQSIYVQLRELRQQVENLQVEVAGQKSIGSIVVWDGQNESSVNQEVSEIFSGLIVHLTPESISAGLPSAEFEQLRKEIVESLDSPPA